MLSQIEIQNKLGDDLKHAIRFGMVILGLIALSIFILLVTLSSQISRISNVVDDMNNNFTTVTIQMDNMSRSIDSMLKRVALLEDMDQQTGTMRREIILITEDITAMNQQVQGMSTQVTRVGSSVNDMAATISQMDDQVQMMAHDMQRMAKPAKTLNKIFPFP